MNVSVSEVPAQPILAVCLCVDFGGCGCGLHGRKKYCGTSVFNVGQRFASNDLPGPPRRLLETSRSPTHVAGQHINASKP